jgi:hypothetical protein
MNAERLKLGSCCRFGPERSVGCKIVSCLTDPRQVNILQSGPGWGDRMQFEQLRRRDFITLAGVTVWSQQQ